MKHDICYLTKKNDRILVFKVIYNDKLYKY